MFRSARSLVSVRNFTPHSLFAFAWLALATLLTGCAGNPAVPAQARQQLAPTGTLRIAVYPGSPTSMVRDPRTGETKGVTLALGEELAKRLGVPFEQVVFQLPAEVVAGLKAGKADMTFTNASPARAKEIDFTPPMLAIEQGFLVLPGSPVTSSGFASVDRPQIRIGVSQGSSSLAALAPQIKQAQIVQAPSLKAAMQMLNDKKVDTYATNKAILNELSDSLPGAVVLPGRFGLEVMAIGIPKGREQGMEYLRSFAVDMMSGGRLQQAVEKAGLRGTVTPPAN
jgi:polar amino acid transport system substrate-binding protein